MLRLFRYRELFNLRILPTPYIEPNHSDLGPDNREQIILNKEMFRLDSPHGEDARDPRHQHGETNYINMLLQLNTIPGVYNILAGLFTWLVLAGYIVLPGTFTSLRNSQTVTAVAEASKAGRLVLKAYHNLGLLWIAAICCAIGVSGMCWLGWMWKKNYIWLRDRIIM
jgi:uncharacterized iron-regulated membrane protein